MDFPELKPARILKKGPRIVRVSGYNGIGVGIEISVARQVNPHDLADSINTLLDMLTWSLGVEVLDEAVKYVWVRPSQYERPQRLFLEIADARGRKRNVRFTWAPQRPSALAQYVFGKRHVHLFKGEDDDKIDPSDITHEIGHGIEQLFSNKTTVQLKKKFNYLVDRKLLPEIRRGRAPIAAADDVLTACTFFSKPDSEVATQHGEMIAYRGYVGRLTGIWSGDPGDTKELRSLRILRGWEELFPELFSLYMLKPNTLMRKSQDLFYFTKRALEDLVGEEVVPITH
ncbi:MAG: hypothetical protein KJ574_04285 [Nanoarchaeota archaeon]|nr:hypothetical protein [Nanoarchaeota archaeon]